MNTVKSYVKQFAAILKGDDAEATAQKALRASDSALKTQIASLTGDLISLEDALEQAQENEKLALLNNGKVPTDRNAYVRNLIVARQSVIDAEENLYEHKETIAYLQSKLEELSSEVEA
jgi:hypothetical protein